MPVEKVTDKQVEKARETVDSLRAQIAATEADIAAQEASRTNVITKVALESEADRLKAQLAALKERQKASSTPVDEDPSVQQLRGEATGVSTPDLGAPEKTTTKKEN